MEGSEWSQHVSNYDDVLHVSIHNKFLSDILPNVQGKMCVMTFILIVLQIVEPYR
jgi:hypothetical protein